MSNTLNLYTKGRSHLYDLSLGLQDEPEFNKVITCWPKFKFKGLPKSKITSYFYIYFIQHLFSKYLDIEKPLLKFIFNNTNYSNRAIVDLNLAGNLQNKFDKLYLDHPTNSYFYQIEQWEFEEENTGVRIPRLHKLKKLYSKIEIEQVYHNADKIIVPSISSKNSFNAEYCDKLVYIPFWIPDMKLEKSVNKNVELTKIAFIGIICPSKGIHYLIDGLKKSDFRGTLHLFGAILNENYVKYLTERKGGVELVFWGHISQDKLFQNIINMNLAIMPSVSEGLPLSYLQALSLGVPVIASKDSSLEEVIGAKYIYETKNSDDLAIKINDFITANDYSFNSLKGDNSYTLENYISEWKKLLHV